MMLEPINDNIIVEVEDNSKEKVTSSGIFIPKGVDNQKQDRGIVKAVGRGRFLANGNVIPPSVKEGDIIIFNRFAGVQVNSEDNKIYLIIKENDILAKINN